MKFMDLLFQKYASPFSLLTGYIQTGRFHEFVKSFCEQKKEDDRWEFYLHKVWDKTYNEFIDALQTVENVQNMTPDDMEATIKESQNILDNFIPPTKEGD